MDVGEHKVVRTKEERSLMGFIRYTCTVVLSAIGCVISWTVDNFIAMWSNDMIHLEWMTLPLAVFITGILYGIKKYFWPDTIL